MIKFWIFFLFTCTLFALQSKSDLRIKYINYNQYTNEMLLEGSTQIKYNHQFLQAVMTLDYLYSSEYKQRRYLAINELYVSKEYDAYSFTFGKTIKFWGALEGHNIADIYNQKNSLLDPFSQSEKLGSLGVSLWRYFDSSSIELTVKLYEEDSDYPSSHTPYFALPLEYNSDLQTQKHRYKPSLYLVYSFTTQNTIDSENKVIFLHGYDNKRYFVNSSQSSLSQYAYRVNKLLFLSTSVYEDTLFKCEASYTDVIDDTKMSDYFQLSFGGEKSFYSLSEIDLSLYLEYYKYGYLQNSKIKNVAISELYNNDIFYALKIDSNTIQESEIKAGLLYDIKNNEKVFQVNIKSRLVDNLEFNAEYLHFLATSTENTFLSTLGDTTRMMLGLTYTY